MFYTIELIYPFNKMILGSRELDEFIVEPWMELEPFDPKLIKKIQPNHPYKNLLWIFYKYNLSYNNWNENDANPDEEGYNDNVIDFYFNMLDDFNRYGITFQPEYNLFPGNKLGVLEEKYYGKSSYSFVNNRYNKKLLLFNKVKTIDLNELDRGEVPISEEEKQKRNLVKKQTNKKLQVVLMDPDIYYSIDLMKHVIENALWYIKTFNHRMTWWGMKEFSKIDFNI